MGKYRISADDDNSYWMLLENEVALCKSKSRNVLVRMRDALVAIEGTGLIGLTVEEDDKFAEDKPRGVVQAISGVNIIVRLTDDKLVDWNVNDCRIVEPEAPTSETSWNDPAIGIHPAIELLKRVSRIQDRDDLKAISIDIESYLAARAAAQPT